MLVSKIPLCMFARYGTRGAVIPSQVVDLFQNARPLGAIARRSASVQTLRAYPARRMRLGLNTSTLPPSVFNDPSDDQSVQLPIYTMPIYFPVPTIEPPRPQVQPLPAAPGAGALATAQSWFAGSSIAGVPNSILAGGFALIVGASLMKSRGRR